MEGEIEPIKTIKSEPVKKIKKKRKSRKKKIKTPPPPSPKKPVYNPILEDELKEKLKYLKKRIYYSIDNDKKQSYQNHIQKLLKRPVIHL